jgi:hypothetical protein
MAISAPPATSRVPVAPAQDFHGARDVEQAGLPAELELRVFGNGQYYGRFLMRPRAGARPALQARLVAVALAEQVGHSYSAAGVSGGAR